MIDGHDRAVLQLSGGADSTALLHKARPWLDHITVLFGDTGAMFPHVREHVETVCREWGADLRIVRPPVPAQQWHAVRGLPSDMVPAWHTPELAWMEAGTPRQLIQSSFACCWQSLWQPMMEAVHSSGATLVLRASRKCDERPGVQPGTVVNGVEYRMPLWDWSDDDVKAYLADEGVPLPRQYEHIHDSLDCWLCTGHSGERGAKERLEYIREHHPDLWPELSARLRLVRAAVSSEAARHDAVYSVIEEPCA